MVLKCIGLEVIKCSHVRNKIMAAISQVLTLSRSNIQLPCVYVDIGIYLFETVELPCFILRTLLLSKSFYYFT